METAAVDTASVEVLPVETAAVGPSTISIAGAETPGSAGVATKPTVSPSEVSAATESEASAGPLIPPTTIAEWARIDTDESVLVSALEAMLRDLAPRRAVLASPFYAIDERVIADFCVEEPGGDGLSYSHVQRGVDLGASGWEISSRFDIVVTADLESCVASFDPSA